MLSTVLIKPALLDVHIMIITSLLTSTVVSRVLLTMCNGEVENFVMVKSGLCCFIISKGNVTLKYRVFL